MEPKVSSCVPFKNIKWVCKVYEMRWEQNPSNWSNLRSYFYGLQESSQDIEMQRDLFLKEDGCFLFNENGFHYATHLKSNQEEVDS